MALPPDGLSQHEPDAVQEQWCCRTSSHSHPLLPLSATKQSELTGNVLSKPSTTQRETKHWDCSLASSPIPEETLQEETSDIRRSQSRLIPSPRIEHQPEGPENTILGSLCHLAHRRCCGSCPSLGHSHSRCCPFPGGGAAGWWPDSSAPHLCEPNPVGSRIPLKPELC